MTSSDMVTILKFISDISGHRFRFPKDGGKEANSMMKKNWMYMLGEYSRGLVMETIRHIAKTTPDWWPNAPEIANRIEQLKKGSVLTPDEAWQKALECAKRSTYHETDKQAFEKNGTPKQVRQAVRAYGGLEKIRMSKETDPWPRKEYLLCYKSLLEKADSAPDVGLIEALRGETKKLGDSMRILESEGE